MARARILLNRTAILVIVRANFLSAIGGATSGAKEVSGDHHQDGDFGRQYLQINTMDQISTSPRFRRVGLRSRNRGMHFAQYSGYLGRQH